MFYFLLFHFIYNNAQIDLLKYVKPIILKQRHIFLEIFTERDVWRTQKLLIRSMT